MKNTYQLTCETLFDALSEFAKSCRKSKLNSNKLISHPENKNSATPANIEYLADHRNDK